MPSLQFRRWGGVEAGVYRFRGSQAGVARVQERGEAGAAPDAAVRAGGHGATEQAAQAPGGFPQARVAHERGAQGGDAGSIRRKPTTTPGVYSAESNFNCCAGSPGRPIAEDTEAIQYALLSNQIDYPYQSFSDWEWRGIESGPNPRESAYKNWYFHTDDPATDLDFDQDPNFDSIEGIYETTYFSNGDDGMDCLTFLSSGPYDIDAGDSIDLSFAIVFGVDEDDLINNAQQIKSTYPLMGDMNQDGSLNVLDIVMMIDLVLYNPNPSDTELMIGDMNGDGFINVMDIVMVVDIILNP